MTIRILLIAEINVLVKRGWTADRALSHLLNGSKVYRDYVDSLTADGQEALRQNIRQQTEAKKS